MPLKELYSKSFRLLKNNPLLAVPFLFAALLAVPWQYFEKGSMQFYGFFLVSIVFGIIMECGTIGMAGKAVSSGKATMDDFSQSVRMYFVRYVLMSLIILGAMLIPIALAVILAIGATVALGQTGALIVIFIILVPLGFAFIAGVIGISFSTQFLIISNEAPTDSLKKSLSFVKTNLWDILVLWLSFFILGIVSSIPVVIVSLINPTPILGAIAGIILSPLSALTHIVAVAFYIEKKS